MMAAPAALGNLRSTGTCISSRAGLRQQPHVRTCLLARRAVQRPWVVVTAAHAAVDAAGTASEVSEDAAEVATARQLVTALLDLQQDSAATASDGATAVAAVVVPANAASAGVNVLQEEEHLVNPEFSNDSAATSGPAVASVESAEQEYAAEEITQQEGEQQAETSHDEESEGVAEAADADAPGQATSEEAAEMLQQISSSIAPALARFGLHDVLLPQLRQHLQQHGTFKRSFLSYSIYISSTSLLCDTRVYAQWCQGVLTCYLCTLWLLEADQLPLKKVNDTKWPRQGPPAVCRSNKIVMQMSIAGDLLAAVRSRFGHAGKPGSGTTRDMKTPTTTRSLLVSCPWMVLSAASSDSTKNQLTLSLMLLGSAASNSKLSQLLPMLNDAVYNAFNVAKAGAAASAGLVAAVAADAVGAKDSKQIQQGILAAAARKAVQYYMVSSPAKLGRMRYMLQHGVPVGVQTIVRFIQDGSPAGQKDKVQAMTGQLTAALEGMLATAKPYWVCLRPPASQRSSSSSSSSQNSIWLFNVPLLLEQNPALRYRSAHLLPPATLKGAAAAAAAAMTSARAVASAERIQLTAAAAVEEAAAHKETVRRSEGSAAPSAMASLDSADTEPETSPTASLDSVPDAAATALRSFATMRGRTAAAYGAAIMPVTASRFIAGRVAAAEARAAASTRLTALYGPHQQVKRGAAVGFDYTQSLPGLGPVQVVTISSAASAAYSSMLQHMAAVPLLGLDTESSWLGSDGSVTVVLSFMAPGVPASGADPGWPDTVYIIDLVAAGLQQRSSTEPGSSSSSSSSSSSDGNSHGSSQAAEAAAASAASDLVAGLAAVFEDPGCTLILQDASQDLPLLQAEFGLSPANVIDTQLCYIMLEAVREQQGLRVRGRQLMRRRLEVLLGAYGLSHPNKMDVVALSRANPMLWLTAPRPLSPELLSYVVADVRYLPALVLLMERDLLQASPGALMRELQPTLPRRLQPPLANGSMSLLQSITQQLMQQQQQDSLGMLSLRDGSWTLPAVAQGLSSSSSSSDHVDSWIEPGANDTVISNLVFRLPKEGKVRLSGTSPGQLQRLLRKPAKPAYQLLVPHEAVAAAEQAVAAARGVTTVRELPSNNGVVANDQQQQQHSSSNNSSSSGGSSSSSSMAWRADPATEHLLSLLPDRLADAIRSSMAAAAASFMRRQAALQHSAAAAEPGTAAAAMPQLLPQLQQLRLIVGSPITYKLGVGGIAAAAASSSSGWIGIHEELFQLKLPKQEALELGLESNCSCSRDLMLQCIDLLWKLQQSDGKALGKDLSSAAGPTNAAADQAGADARQMLFGSTKQRHQSGLLQLVTPIGLQNSNEEHGCIPAGLLFTAARRQTGISQVLGDFLASLAQQALAVNALGGNAHHMQQQQQQQVVGALPSTWPSLRSSYGRVLRGSSVPAQAAAEDAAAQQQSQQEGNAAARQQRAALRDVAAWQLGLQPPNFGTPSAPAGSSSSSRTPGLFVLLLGPSQSGKSSMLQDVAATLADNSCISVAAVDMEGRLASSSSVQARLLGKALPLHVEDAASQAAAVQSAWQLHKCHVIAINNLSGAALPAVQAALAAGVSVVAAANGFADVAALHASYAAAASGSSSSSSSATGGAALWDLLDKLSSDGSSQRCCVVECVPGYRWVVHKQLARSLQLLQQAPAADSAAATVPAGLTAVLPVQLRQFVATGAAGLPAAAAVDSTGCLTQRGTDADSSSSVTSSSGGNAAAGQADGVVAVTRFASYGAAAGDLSLPLLRVVRELLYAQPLA